MHTPEPKLSYKDFIARYYPTEKDMLDFIVKAKFKGTFMCLKCGAIRNICRQKYDAKKLYCFNKDCLSEFSILQSTMFAHTHIDLRIWFYIIYLLKIENINTPALKLQDMVGIKSYKSILRIKKVILKVLEKPEKKNEADLEIVREFTANFH